MRRRGRWACGAAGCADRRRRPSPSARTTSNCASSRRSRCQPSSNASARPQLLQHPARDARQQHAVGARGDRGRQLARRSAGPTKRVDVSTDGGASWRPARLRWPLPHAWVRWEYPWSPPGTPGAPRLRRAPPTGPVEPSRRPYRSTRSATCSGRPSSTRSPWQASSDRRIRGSQARVEGKQRTSPSLLTRVVVGHLPIGPARQPSILRSRSRADAIRLHETVLSVRPASAVRLAPPTPRLGSDWKVHSDA
jgi:hypothetical protein